MTFDARSCTAGSILAQDRPISVPLYQRRYEWTPKEMDQLLSDLHEAFSAGPARSSYFIGSLIFHKPARGNIQVVDGQQRLTSLSLILAAARDLTADAAKRDEIDGYLSIPHEDGPKQRLILRREDEEFYAKHVVPVGATASHPESQDSEGNERLRNSIGRARKWLTDEFSDAQRSAFADFILQGCHAIRIDVHEEDDAFLIFERINNRGRPLRPEDVLRPLLTEYATDDPKVRGELMRKWDSVERRLGEKDMERFIAQLRSRRRLGRRSNKPLHRDIADSFATREDALAFLRNELVPMAETYAEVAIDQKIKGLGVSPEKLKIDALLRSMALIPSEEAGEWVPAAIMFIERWRSEPAVLIEHLKGLERLVWFYYLKRDDKKIGLDRRARFGEILKHLIEQPAFDPDECGFNLTANEKGEMRRFITERVDSRWVPLKLLLVRLEHALWRGREPARLMNYTIEHVLPLNPTDDYWYERFDRKRAIVKDYAERIGNLCLVSRPLNVLLGNKPYPEKRELALAHRAHKESRLAADFEAETDWTKDIIERRTGWLLKRFCDEFGVHA